MYLLGYNLPVIEVDRQFIKRKISAIDRWVHIIFLIISFDYTIKKSFKQTTSGNFPIVLK